jgi:hypothetical protein
LIAGDGDERDRGGGCDVEVLGDKSKFFGLYDTEFCVRGMSEGEDTVASFEACYAFAYFANDTGEIAAKNAGKGDWKAVLRCAGAHLEVDWVDAGGMQADEDFAGTCFGVFEVLVLELRGRTVLVENDCFHDYTSELLRCI